jgi:hypothetical protein
MHTREVLVDKSVSRDEPRSVKVSVTFTAAVLAVERCTIADVTVRLSRGSNDRWTGEAPIVPSPEPQPFRLIFRAPSGTAFVPGFGIFVTEAGAPLKIQGGFTIEAIDRKARLGLQVGFPF